MSLTHQKEVIILLLEKCLSSLLIWLYQWVTLLFFHSSDYWKIGCILTKTKPNQKQTSESCWNCYNETINHHSSVPVPCHHPYSPPPKAIVALGHALSRAFCCSVFSHKLTRQVLTLLVNTCSFLGKPSSILGSYLSREFKQVRYPPSHRTRSLELGGCWPWLSYSRISGIGLRVSEMIFTFPVLMLRWRPQL